MGYKQYLKQAYCPKCDSRLVHSNGYNSIWLCNECCEYYRMNNKLFLCKVI